MKKQDFARCQVEVLRHLKQLYPKGVRGRELPELALWVTVLLDGTVTDVLRRFCKEHGIPTETSGEAQPDARPS